MRSVSDLVLNYGYGRGAESEQIERFKQDEENIFLISYPRSGSHWLRVLMELYFGRPVLTRVFYRHDNEDFLLLHDHDLDLDIERKNIVYLKRRPVDVIFSKLFYDKKTGSDENVIGYANAYKTYRDKWSKEDFTEKRLDVTYEKLCYAPKQVLNRLSEYYNQTYDERRAQSAVLAATRDEVARLTSDNRLIAPINVSGYGELRNKFKSRHSDSILEVLHA